MSKRKSSVQIKQMREMALKWEAREFYGKPIPKTETGFIRVFGVSPYTFNAWQKDQDFIGMRFWAHRAVKHTSLKSCLAKLSKKPKKK
jgi:hypothetical protein